MKGYTDLEQSKKLAEILSLESADMFYCYGMDIKTKEWSYDKTPTIEDELYKRDIGDIPCWSLAALLDVLPQGEYKDTDLCHGGYKEDKYISEWFCSYEQQEPIIIEICHADNPVHACVAMIERLNELNLL